MIRRREIGQEANAWRMWQGHIDQAFAVASATDVAGHGETGEPSEGHGVAPQRSSGQRAEAVAAASAS